MWQWVSPFQKRKPYSTRQSPTRWLSRIIHDYLIRTGQNFFAALYGQPKCSSMNTARYMIYTKKKGKPPLVKSLPPTDKNLLLHMLRAHCQALLWKAADKQNAPSHYWVWLGVAQQRPISCNSKWTASTSWPNENWKLTVQGCREGLLTSKLQLFDSKSVLYNILSVRRFPWSVSQSNDSLTWGQCNYQWCRREKHWFWHWSPWILDTMFDTNMHINIASYMQTNGL